MKRFFKKLFSRFSLVGLTIIIMFVVDFLVAAGVIIFLDKVLVYFFPYADPYITWGLRVLQWLITAAAVLHCANRDMIPETKIPWLLCILLLNVFGVAIYATFSSSRPLKRQNKAFNNLREHIFSLEPDAEEQSSLREGMGEWADESAALTAMNRSSAVYANTKTEYFPLGERFAERFIEDLKNAKEYIFLEYFIICRGKFWNAVLDIL